MRDDDLQLSLVWQAKNGNAQALNALLDANKGKIYAAAYALLKNREDAEDAMQQALIAVWQNIGKLAAPEAFETWLYRVTYTRSLNILKSRKNNEMVIENDIGDMPQAALLESELMLPHEYAERNDLRERLFLIIDSLSPVQRETVVLYYFHDKSVGEISEIMDCSAGTVKSRLYLARNTIRTEIEEQERKSGQKFFGFAVGAVPLGRFVAENTAKDDAVASGGSKNPICRAAGGVCRRKRRCRRCSGRRGNKSRSFGRSKGCHHHRSGGDRDRHNDRHGGCCQLNG